MLCADENVSRISTREDSNLSRLVSSSRVNMLLCQLLWLVTFIF